MVFLDLRREVVGCSQAVLGILVSISSRCSGIGPHLELRQATRAFSRGVTRESDLPSCCEGILRIPCQ